MNDLLIDTVFEEMTNIPKEPIKTQYEYLNNELSKCDKGSIKYHKPFQNKKKLEFDYTNSNGYKFKATIHPYGIQYWEKNYLVGFDEYSKEIFKYTISKIKNIKNLMSFLKKMKTLI